MCSLGITFDRIERRGLARDAGLNLSASWTIKENEGQNLELGKDWSIVITRRENSRPHLPYIRHLVIMLIVITSPYCIEGCGSGKNDLARESGSPSTITLSGSSFGMHIQRATEGTPWPTVAFGTWRLWDTGTCWFNLEPARNLWHFDLLDSLVAKGESNNEELILTLGQTPRWASARPTESSPYSLGAAAEPVSEQDWIDYVTKVVQRYKGHIQYYEVWNEPNLTITWTGSTDRLLQMQADAYAVIHREDPAAKVISPSITSDYGIPYFQTMLRKGMAEYADVIGYHFYVLGNPPEQISTLADEVNSSLVSAGVTGKEVWNTETGWAQPNTFPDSTIAAAWVVRAHLVAFSKGITRFIWYAWDSQSWVTLHLTTSDYAATSAATAYAVLEDWLKDAKLAPCVEGADEVWSCAIVQGRKKGVIFWHSGGTVTTDLPRAWKAAHLQDAFGNRSGYSGSTAQASDLPQLITE